MSLFNLVKTYFRRQTVKPMDRFEKAEKNGASIWIVDEVITIPDMPVHARLIRQWAGATEFRTVSVAALLDETIYRPLPPVEGQTSPDPSTRG